MTPAELIKWREDKGLTQSAAAKKIGMTARQWQKLEAGDHPIRRIHSLALLALSTRPCATQLRKWRTTMHEDIIRQRFEEWCDKEKWERERYVGGQFHGYYVHSFTRAAWDIWQAAYASMREIEEQPAPSMGEWPEWYATEPVHPTAEGMRALYGEQPADPDKAINAIEAYNNLLSDLQGTVDADSFALLLPNLKIIYSHFSHPITPDKAMMEEMADGMKRCLSSQLSDNSVLLKFDDYNHAFKVQNAFNKLLSKYRNAAPAEKQEGV